MLGKLKALQLLALNCCSNILLIILNWILRNRMRSCGWDVSRSGRGKVADLFEYDKER
jgi:hypothetical protein